MSSADGDDVRHRHLGALVPAHQVRSMVGSLVRVGEGRWSADDLAAALAARRPRRLRPGRAAARALSGAGGLLSIFVNLCPACGERSSRSAGEGSAFELVEEPLTRPSPRQSGRATTHHPKYRSMIPR